MGKTAKSRFSDRVVSFDERKKICILKNSIIFAQNILIMKSLIFSLAFIVYSALTLTASDYTLKSNRNFSITNDPDYFWQSIQ
jgi:hypothetical protein